MIWVYLSDTVGEYLVYLVEMVLGPGFEFGAFDPEGMKMVVGEGMKMVVEVKSFVLQGFF